MSGDKKSALEPSKSSGRFDRTELPDKIGRSLRQIYDDVLNEDVPDDFLDILKSADDRPEKSDRDAPK